MPYLGAQEFSLAPAQFAALLPAPPVDDSPEGLADMETVLQVQADRTPEQTQRAKRVDTQTPFSFGQPAIGEWFQAENLPRTAAIFELATRQANHVIDASKKQWHRPRPYHRSDQVILIVGDPKNLSYPSGHSACAAVWGELLCAAFPEDAAEIQKQVRETMWGRVMAGAHFPSDTTAGQSLGAAIGKALLAKPEMQEAIKTIREEAAPFLLKKAA